MFLNLYKRRVSRIIDRDRIDEIDDSMIYRTGLKEQVEYEALCNDNPDNEEIIDEIIETMVEMMLCMNPRQQISGNEYSSELVKQRVMRTYRKHVEYMMTCLAKNTTKISNIKGYLKATIFNAQSTIDSYYRAEVNHNEYSRETKKSNTYNGYTFEELELMAMSN